MSGDTSAGVPTVFVSYAAADRRWAEWLACQLTACGFEPLLEAWHAVPGTNLVQWLDDALVRADRLLLVLSESYLNETAASAQWQAGFAVTDNRLVPVKVGACSPRGLLANLVAVDLVGLDEEASRTALLDGLRAVVKGFATPVEAPSFPGVAFPERTEAAFPPQELPPGTRLFTGRQQEVTQLLSVGREVAGGGHTATGGVVVLLSVDGMAGVGKTALALHAAHQLTASFPDGCLFLDLHGSTPSVDPVEPGSALEELLRRLGVPGEQIPHPLDARTALYRSRLAGTRTLIVLDNARSTEQIRPLLPAAPQCLVLVTSRRRLTALDEARSLQLDVLPRSDALAMFIAVVGADRLAEQSDAAERVIDLCGRLPLALRIAAARLRARPAWTVADLADLLADHHSRLDELDDGERSVAAAFAVSYRDLTRDQQQMLRGLGLHPGVEMDSFAAAALTGTTPAEAGRLCGHLLGVHLLTESARERYRFHDLVRAFAHERAVTEDSGPVRQRALTALFDHYVSTAAVATRVVFPSDVDYLPPVPPPCAVPRWAADPQGARKWLDLERANLVRVSAHATTHGWHDHSTSLAAILFRYLDLGAHLTEATVLYTHACRAARASGDRAKEAHVLTSLAGIYRHQGKYQRAAVAAHQALDLFREVSDEPGQGRALTSLGIICWRRGRYDEANYYNHQALDLYRRTDDPRGQARALGNLAHVHWRQGRHEQAVDHNQQALRLYRQTDDPRGQAHALGNLGNVYWCQGDHQLAAEHHRQALDLYRSLGDRNGQADAMTNLGLVHHAQGRHRSAAEHHMWALELYEEIGDRNGQARAYNGLAEHCYATGHPDQARDHHARALALTLDTEDRYEQARSHAGLGRAHHWLGDHDNARHHWQQARDIYAELDVPEVQEVDKLLKRRRAAGS